MGLSIYQLKPRFQQLLRPWVRWLHGVGVTANGVTLLACVVSCLVGAVVWHWAAEHWIFMLVPLWMFARMALNAIDGMLAREFDQKSALGGFLNEVTDLIADAALILPFMGLHGVDSTLVVAVCLGAWLTEFVGVVAVAVSASRSYDGPMGKSDRAVAFGVMALLAAMGVSFQKMGSVILWAVLLALAWTVVNRVRSALQELKKVGSTWLTR
jgi:CDP-diacylglycerol---glycerol-3-phosphate 3-phosphatidyltransferase